jgi:hypothetical protein
MSAATEQAKADFGSSLKDAHNLVWLHRNSQGGQGRRHRQTTLNRAVVVVTAAAWQAYVQDTTQAILAALAVPHGHQGHALYALTRAAAKNAVRRFNTPNARNTLGLFGTVGFDPEPVWSFTIGTPPRVYAPQNVRAEINDWFDVRHAIAHGSQLPAIPLVSGQAQAGRTLHRGDAERCISFFESVVNATAAAAHQQFP